MGIVTAMEAFPTLIVCGERVLGVEGAEAVAVLGERIEAVGPRDEILSLRGRGTRLAHVPGGLVCPGFQDAHVHLPYAGTVRLEPDLRGLDAEGIGRAVADAAAGRPQGRWVVGNGYFPALLERAGITPRALLDRAAPGRPVLLRSYDGHAAILNTPALETAGIGRSSPGGPLVERDDAGEPTGLLLEETAWEAERHTDRLRTEERLDAVARVIPDLHRAGITAVHDMSGSGALETLRSLDADGRLGIDVFATVSPEDCADERLRQPGRFLRVVGVKAFLDGALGSRTAHLLEPYEGDDAHHGIESLDAASTRDVALRAAEAGLACCLHAIGDAAVRSALDAFQACRGAATPNLRHRVEHAQMVHDRDLPRFAELGVVASIQPVHLAEDAPLALAYWGERSREAFPLRRLLDAGAPLAFGSDAPIETFDVLEGIAAAVSRTARDGTVLHPEEAVTVEEALDAYTRGAAYAAGCEDAFGSVAPGHVASLTVLGTDIERHPPSMGDCAVAATVVRGEVVFERSPS